jgi:hypothetical protein
MERGMRGIRGMVALVALVALVCHVCVRCFKLALSGWECGFSTRIVVGGFNPHQPSTKKTNKKLTKTPQKTKITQEHLRPYIPLLRLPLTFYVGEIT